MSEATIQANIRKAAGLLVTLFRNNVALAAAGKIQWIKSACTVRLNPGDAVVRNARPLHAGLCKGSSDLVGDKMVTITPDMVGKCIAVAVYLECKDDDGRATPDQINFISQAKKRGAIAGIVRSVAEALAILNGSVGV